MRGATALEIEEQGNILTPCGYIQNGRNWFQGQNPEKKMAEFYNFQTTKPN